MIAFRTFLRAAERYHFSDVRSRGRVINETGIQFGSIGKKNRVLLQRQEAFKTGTHTQFLYQ